MTYAIYYIHPQSLSVNIRDFYQKYDTAIKRLKPDVEEFIQSTKNVSKVEYINKKIDISSKNNGYYLKVSNKYPNRITVYEKTSRDIGYIFSNVITEIKKVFVFSLLELTSVPDELNINLDVKEVSRKVMPKVEVLYMQELKEKIKQRLDKYD